MNCLTIVDLAAADTARDFETPTNSASACQCLGCGRLPFRIWAAYTRETPINFAITALEASASKGWIFSEKNCSVSHAGWLDASQERLASWLRRCVLLRLACASGVFAVSRPTCATSAMCFDQPSAAQLLQCVNWCRIVFPHPRHRFSLRTGGTGGGNGPAPFASRGCSNKRRRGHSPCPRGFRFSRSSLPIFLLQVLSLCRALICIFALPRDHCEHDVVSGCRFERRLCIFQPVVPTRALLRVSPVEKDRFRDPSIS